MGIAPVQLDGGTQDSVFRLACEQMPICMRQLLVSATKYYYIEAVIAANCAPFTFIVPRYLARSVREYSEQLTSSWRRQET